MAILSVFVLFLLTVLMLLPRSSQDPNAYAASGEETQAVSPPVSSPPPTDIAPTPTPDSSPAPPSAAPTPPTAVATQQADSASEETAPPAQEPKEDAPSAPEGPVEPVPTIDPGWLVPQGEAVDQESWFADAVFIGDSRTDGFHLYSGVTAQASFLDYTGLTIFDVDRGKAVIRSEGKKISILDALAQKPYGKVYLSLGINELGGYDPQGFAQAYGRVLDAVRECQPDALVYVQAIIPVNAALCKAHDIPDYITNAGVTSYNQALAALCKEKDVPFVGVPDGLLDENGETQSGLSADGVHFKKEGYALWLAYLTTHTGT